MVISIPLLLTGILQLNRMVYFAYGSLLVYVAAASMRNYKDGIHNPVALYKKYAAIGKKTIEWIEINRTVLTVVITACIIIFIVYSKGAVGKMFFIWNLFFLYGRWNWILVYIII